jgi:transposase
VGPSPGSDGHGRDTGRRWVTRRPGEEYFPENIDPTFRSGRQSLMVWACIAHGRKGPLVRLDTDSTATTSSGRKRRGGLDGTRYVEQVLDGPLITFVTYMEKERGRKMLVVEDGAPAHRSVVAKQARSRLGITNLNHPPSSPDLNPLEPLWLVLKTRVANIPGSGNSLDALWSAIQQVWDELTEDDIRKHTGQMDARVAAVKAAKGWQTKF